MKGTVGERRSYKRMERVEGFPSALKSRPKSRRDRDSSSTTDATRPPPTTRAKPCSAPSPPRPGCRPARRRAVRRRTIGSTVRSDVWGRSVGGGMWAGGAGWISAGERAFGSGNAVRLITHAPKTHTSAQAGDGEGWRGRTEDDRGYLDGHASLLVVIPSLCR